MGDIERWKGRPANDDFKVSKLEHDQFYKNRAQENFISLTNALEDSMEEQGASEEELEHLKEAIKRVKEGRTPVARDHSSSVWDYYTNLFEVMEEYRKPLPEQDEAVIRNYVTTITGIMQKRSK